MESLMMLSEYLEARTDYQPTPEVVVVVAIMVAEVVVVMVIVVLVHVHVLVLEGVLALMLIRVATTP